MAVDKSMFFQRFELFTGPVVTAGLDLDPKDLIKTMCNKCMTGVSTHVWRTLGNNRRVHYVDW